MNLLAMQFLIRNKFHTHLEIKVINQRKIINFKTLINKNLSK